MIIKDKKVEKIIKDNQKEKHKLKHIVSSFFYGGVIGMFAQGLYELFFTLLNIDENTSTTLTSGVIVFIAFLLTCLGVFDKLSNIAYLGVIIPISGFANSITSSALEGKSEGLIFGIGSKIFSLIGSVISIGIVSSIAFGFIYYLIKVIA